MKGFENWLVFYRPLQDGIEAVRILHGARDLGPLLLEDDSSDERRLERRFVDRLGVMLVDSLGPELDDLRLIAGDL